LQDWGESENFEVEYLNESQEERILAKEPQLAERPNIESATSGL